MASVETQWSEDREIVLTRVIAAPRELLFKVWTDPAHFPKWFGPEGFTITPHAMDARVGGHWRFDMNAPDGTVFDNRIVFLEISPPERIVFEHGHDKDNDPTRFRVTVTFESQANGKTVVTLRQLHPTVEQRRAGIGFGAVELGYQTLDKLDRYTRGL